MPKAQTTEALWLGLPEINPRETTAPIQDHKWMVFDWDVPRAPHRTESYKQDYTDFTPLRISG